MPGKNADLHGSAPDKSDVALLLIDVINDLEFPEGDQLLRHAIPVANRHCVSSSDVRLLCHRHCGCADEPVRGSAPRSPVT